MNIHTLEEVQDAIIGKIGTPERDAFEYELQMDMIGRAIKRARRERHMTQEELGRRIGVQKSQISKIESHTGNVTMDTLVRVFAALQAMVTFQVELSRTMEAGS